MHCLFSPTALDHDLSYVDKTYYHQQQPFLPLQDNVKSAAASAMSLQNDKQQSNVQSIVLNKTIGLVASVSRLDL
jgi:hypothetical protein